MNSKSRDSGIAALGFFFLAGAVISFTASISLLFPNRFLKSIWQLNPRAHENLSRLGIWAVVLLLIVSMSCAAASIGLFRTSWWGYWIAVALISINLVGDVLNVLLGTEPRAIVGLPFAAAVLTYLLRKKVRDVFS